MNDVTFSYLGGHCPTQAEGLAPSGRPFYFRARHGWWTLELGPVGDPPDYLSWSDDGEEIAEGEDPSFGFMDPDDVRAIPFGEAG